MNNVNNYTSVMSSFFLFMLFLAFTSTSSATTTTDIKYCRLLGNDIHVNAQDGSFSSQVDGEKIKTVCTSKSLRLHGISSAPPRCVSKCRKCTPCVPVRVVVPMRSAPEYKPEVWRCECANNLYMP